MFTYANEWASNVFTDISWALVLAQIFNVFFLHSHLWRRHQLAQNLKAHCFVAIKRSHWFLLEEYVFCRETPKIMVFMEENIPSTAMNGTLATIIWFLRQTIVWFGKNNLVAMDMQEWTELLLGIGTFRFVSFSGLLIFTRFARYDNFVKKS